VVSRALETEFVGAELWVAGKRLLSALALVWLAVFELVDEPAVEWLARAGSCPVCSCSVRKPKSDVKAMPLLQRTARACRARRPRGWGRGCRGAISMPDTLAEDGQADMRRR